MSTSIDNTNYLEDSDFLSTDDEAGYFTSDEEEIVLPLIESIINKNEKNFNKLINDKNNLSEKIYDNLLKRKINPLQVSLKYYSNTTICIKK